jgi:16S rRNA processing protein RimM
MNNSQRRILVARVVGAFGVRGEVKLQSFTDPLKQVLKYQPWILVHNGQEKEITEVRARETNKGLTVFFPDIDDRDVAEALTGAEVWVPRSRLPAPKNGEYYWIDLEGMQVHNLEGVDFGKVSHLFNNGANDVMFVQGERVRLLPFVMDDYIKNIDFDAQQITVDWEADF